MRTDTRALSMVRLEFGKGYASDEFDRRIQLLIKTPRAISLPCELFAAQGNIARLGSVYNFKTISW
jgi:hypothetical protein